MTSRRYLLFTHSLCALCLVFNGIDPVMDFDVTVYYAADVVNLKLEY